MPTGSRRERQYPSPIYHTDNAAMIKAGGMPGDRMGGTGWITDTAQPEITGERIGEVSKGYIYIIGRMKAVRQSCGGRPRGKARMGADVQASIYGNWREAARLATA